MRGGLTERTVVAGGLLAIVIGAAFAILLSSVADLRAAQRRALQSESVLVAANRLERLVIDLESAQRGFLLTGDEQFLQPWTTARAEYPNQAATLRRLLAAGDPDQQARAERIVRAADSYLEDYSVPTVRAAMRDRASVPIDDVSLQGKRRVDDLRAEFDQFTTAEQGLATEREERTDAATRRAIIAAAGGLAVSVLLIVLYTGYLTSAMVRPLRQAAALAGRVAGGDLSARLPERGIGEIGALERSLNTMAGSLERGRAELARSRARVVTAGDRARRKIERDLHDGTQQRLVSLLLELRSAEAAVPADQPEQRAQLARIGDELGAAVEDLRELARGIHPAILSEGGLGPALKSLARRSAVVVELDLDLPARLPEPVEVAAYYVVSEALANASKHAHADVVTVTAAAERDKLRLSVRDDGVGGAAPGSGTGLIGLTDRVESMGGTILMDSPPGEGTTLRVELPAGAG